MMWRRRELLGAIGTGAAGLAWIATTTEAAASQSGEDDPKHASMTKSCCDVCGQCADACNKAFHHCINLASSGKMSHAKAAQIMADCAAFCALSALMISRQSMLMALSCRACADACRHCAQECASFGADQEMKNCREACERCEESCRNMVKSMGADSTGSGGKRVPD